MNLTGETASEVTTYSTFSKLIAKYGTLLAISFIILCLLTLSVFSNSLGLIGDDSDDIMRLVQIKDYLAGQSWFHTDQYRLGLNGTDMHWSRIPDIPIIILTHFFDIFLPQDRALVWAFTIWPPLSSALLVWACFVGAKNWQGEKIKLFVFILLAVFFLTSNRFTPGAIDHHNLQLGFIAMSMAFALDRKLRFWPYFTAGFAAAMSVAIGVEVYIFVAVICAFVAVAWAFKAQSFAAAAQGFGLGFSITLLLAFFGTIAPSEYNLIYCDAFSLVTVTAGVTGAMGLVLLTKMDHLFSLNDSLLRRVLMLGLIGGICMSVLLLQAPQCLASPLESLPDDVISLWLDNISEAKPLFHLDSEKFTRIPFILGVPILALIIIGLDMRADLLQRRKTGEAISATSIVKVLPFVLLISALAITVYQRRFFPFAHVLAIIPLAGWIAKSYVELKLKNPGSVMYLAALALSVPTAWMVPGILLEKPVIQDNGSESKEGITVCSSENMVESLNNLPSGKILANADVTGLILLETDHQAVTGNYHRNWKGISTGIQIAISNPNISGEHLLKNNIDYLYHCSNANETLIYAQYNTSSLVAKLSQDEVPSYLEHIASPDSENGPSKIFKVKRPKP